MKGAARAGLILAAFAASASLLLAGAAGGSPAGPEASAARAEVPAPKTKWDPIPYDRARKRQMAAYSKRHYGQREWRLDDPRAIVLHYTAGSSYESAFNTFASNAPNNGERPGVCAQFVVDKDGTIYQLTRLYVRCRHTIGLNHVAVGIEMVQEDAGGSHATSQAILDRRAQSRAAVRLAAWLRTRYRIGSRNLIGHAMANDSPLFKDEEGWRNDHTDWPKAEVKTFRKRVVRVIKDHKRVTPRAGDSRVVFGRSVEGRRLTAQRIGDPDAKRTALIVGEIHGDEDAGRAVIRRLRRHPGALRGVDAWTVASLNPDGHVADRRTNEHGVDLNRNFGVGWSGDEPPGSGYYGGPHPFSEPESKALRRLVRRTDPDLTIYYHQPWGAVLMPCHGAAPAQQRYSRISGLEGDRCRGQHLPGTATRWQNRRGGTAFVVELEAGELSDRDLRRHTRAAARVAAG